MALKCTNTSGPDSCEMKPYPFSALNHFTTPTGTNVPPGGAAPRASDPAPYGGGPKGDCSKRLDLLNPSLAPYQARWTRWHAVPDGLPTGHCYAGGPFTHEGVLMARNNDRSRGSK